MKMYCINLEENINKKENVIRQFNQSNLELIFFKAILGNKLHETIINTINNHHHANKLSKRKNGLLKPEIGCLLSHMKVYELISESNDIGAFIIEDDVYAHRDFFRILKPLQAKVTSNDLILLGGDSGIEYFRGKNAFHGTNKIWIQPTGLTQISHPYKIGYPIDRLWGAYGYFIGREAAIKLLKAHRSNIIFVADQITSESPRFGVDFKTINHPVIFPDYSFQSDIRSEHKINVKSGIHYGYLRSLQRIIKRLFSKRYPYLN